MSKRNTMLDALKAVAAMMIVCLHTSIPTSLSGDLLRAVARAGVPFFFIISGYYGWRPDADRQKRLSTLIKHLKTWALVCAVYILVHSVPDLVHLRFPEAVRTTLLSPQWLLNNFGLVGHMWFVHALIYIDVIMLLFETGIAKVKWRVVLPMIWLLDVILLKYSIILFGFVVQPQVSETVSKYLCNAGLYFFLGYYIRMLESEKGLGTYCTLPYVIAALVAGTAGSVVESALLITHGVDTMPVNYIFTMPLSVALFLLGLVVPTGAEGSMLAWVGLNISMYIYYWHKLIIQVMGKVLPARFDWIVQNPLTVYAIALLVGCGIYWCKQRAETTHA